MIYLILLMLGMISGYFFGARVKDESLISVLINHLLGCSRSKLCRCCQSTQVMFLPDDTQPCKSFYKALMGLNPHGHCSFENEQKLFKNRYKPRIPCKFNHGLANERPSALVELYKMLGSAQESICICIMMIKLKEMIQFLRYMKLEKNIKIQVIINTKCKQEFSSKKEMKILQDAGVEVKTNHQGMVHNKFVIVDRKTLISGSINWTYVAFNNNDETIMFTSQWAIVDKFLSKFDQMWEQMSPLTSNTVYIDEPKPSPRRVEGCLLAFAGKRRPTFDSDNDSDEDYSIMRRDLDSSREDILASSEADAESSEEPISFSFAKPKYVGAF